jgi:hypothetical protein
MWLSTGDVKLGRHGPSQKGYSPSKPSRHSKPADCALKVFFLSHSHQLRTGEDHFSFEFASARYVRGPNIHKSILRKAVWAVNIFHRRTTCIQQGALNR